MILTDSAHIWHVAKSGNDANSGHAGGYPVNLASDAKLTITAAITAASPSDMIVIWPGTYSEAVTVSKKLNLIGFGINQTIITNASTHGLQFSSSAGISSGSFLKGVSCISTATGVSYGINLGYSHQNITIEDCYGEGDYDGIHLRNSNRTKLIRCHGKGKFDGIQAGDGEGHLLVDCVAETDGSNTVDDWTNAFVCSDAKGVRISNLYCKARRSLAGDSKHLAGARIKGQVQIDRITIDVDHSGTGNHKTTGLVVDTTNGDCLATQIQAIVKAATGSVYGLSVDNGKLYAETINVSVELTQGGAVYGGFVDGGKNLTLMRGQIITSVPAPGLSSNVTGQVSGFEKSRFFDSALSAIPDDTFNGWTLRWMSGANLGETQPIDDFIQTGGEVRFASDFTNDIQVGDSYELYSAGVPTAYSLFNNAGQLNLAQLFYDDTLASGIITKDLDNVKAAAGGSRF